MSRRVPSTGRAAAAALACALFTLSATGPLAPVAAHGTPGRPMADAARVTGVRDEGRLSYVSNDATRILDQGPVSGTLPGTARVDFAYDGSPAVSAHFSIYTRAGAIYGWASCRLHNPNSPTPSFRGALHITGGSRRYAHARGSGELFGIFHRRGYALVVQALGTLRY